MLGLKGDYREKRVTCKQHVEKIAVARGVSVYSTRYIDRKEGSLGPQESNKRQTDD